MKTCSKCKEEKDESCFFKNKGNKDGLKNTCKLCSSLYNQVYRKENKEKIYESNKKRFEANKEKVYSLNKKWAKNNRDKINEIAKKWRLNNKEKLHGYYLKNRETILISNKKRAEENKEKLSEKAKIYYLNNQEKIKNKIIDWQLKNKDKVKDYKKRWILENKDKSVCSSMKSYHRRINGVVLPDELIETIVLINKTKQLCKTLNN